MVVVFLGFGIATLGYVSWKKHVYEEKMNKRLYFKTPAKKEEIVVSEVDQATTHTWINVVYRFDSIFNENKMKQGLIKAIELYPQVGARLNRENAINTLSVGNENENWIEFIVADGTKTNLPDANSVFSDWEGFGCTPKPGLPGSHEPLFLVKLEKYDQVSYLGVAFNHVLGDAQSMVDFLKCWSDCCNIDIIPTQINNNKRYFKILQPICNTKEELEKLWENKIDKNGPSPMSSTIDLKQWEEYMKQHSLVEFRVSKEKLSKFKKNLPYKGWVSSYEVLMGTVLHYRGDSKIPIIAINLRNRIDWFDKQYFGNGTFDVPLGKPMNGKDLWETIWNLHNTLREVLADEDKSRLTRIKEWREQARCNFHIDSSDLIWIPFIRSLNGTGMFLNSWGRYDWFGITFGQPVMPSTFFCGIQLPPGMILEQPRCQKTGDTTIWIHVPNSNLHMLDNVVPFLQRVE